MVEILEKFSAVIGNTVTPLILFLSAAVMIPTIHFGKILKPRNFLRTFRGRTSQTSASPLHALAIALAGTLGVGNITGVASALIAGGPGAIFWMWIGALLVLAVKYAEVYFAVRYRQKDEEGH